MASTTRKAIAKAVKRFGELSFDKETRVEYEFCEKALRDYNSFVFDTKDNVLNRLELKAGLN